MQDGALCRRLPSSRKSLEQEGASPSYHLPGAADACHIAGKGRHLGVPGRPFRTRREPSLPTMTSPCSSRGGACLRAGAESLGRLLLIEKLAHDRSPTLAGHGAADIAALPNACRRLLYWLIGSERERPLRFFRVRKQAVSKRPIFPIISIITCGYWPLAHRRRGKALTRCVGAVPTVATLFWFLTESSTAARSWQ